MSRTAPISFALFLVLVALHAPPVDADLDASAVAKPPAKRAPLVVITPAPPVVSFEFTLEAEQAAIGVASHWRVYALAELTSITWREHPGPEPGPALDVLGVRYTTPASRALDKLDAPPLPVRRAIEFLSSEPAEPERQPGTTFIILRQATLFPPAMPAEAAAASPRPAAPPAEEPDAFVVMFGPDGDVRYAELQRAPTRAQDDVLAADTGARPAGRRSGKALAGAAGQAARTADGGAAAAVSILLILAIAGLGVAVLGVGLFSRFDRDDVLDHPRRAQIFEAVRAEPGIPFGRLRERLGLVQGVAQHHLALLLQHGLLASVRDGRATRYYVRGPKPPSPPLEGTRARVVDTLRAEPGLTVRELSQRLALREQSVWEHVGRLSSSGLLVAEEARPKRWRVAA